MRAMRATMNSISGTSTRPLRSFRAAALARAGLVDHVDRLVRQQAVGDVLDRQVHRGLERIVRVFDLVVFLEARLEALEDLDAVGDRRLDDVDLLEAPRQRAILLEHAAVFLERGRADAAQLAAGEHGLDQVGRVHRATRCGTGTDDRVDFVDEQDRAGLLLELADDGLEALLEVAAVLGAGNERTEVERPDDRVLEHVRHVAFDDALGQTFGERGLADAGFADVERIVLAAAAQHLDRALDFLFAPDQRIDLALPREFVEVVRELGERIAARFLAGFAFGLRFRAGRTVGGFVADLGDAVRDEIDDVEPRHVLLAEEIDRVRILLAEDRDEHVRAGHFFTAGRLHVVDRALQNALETERRLRVALVALRQHGHGFGDDRAQVAREFGQSAPQARSTPTAEALSSNARSRCSTVMNS
jgi:hypothetical protein